MADVFLSYAREDRATASLIAGALTSRGWSVWWDRKIAPGHTFEAVIERELAASRCVIVLWSAQSIGSTWVKNEAGDAGERGTLVPALIEQVRVPIAFRHIHSADLVGWDGDAGHAEFQEIVQRVAELAPLDIVKSPASEASASVPSVLTEPSAPAVSTNTPAVGSTQVEDARPARVGEHEHEPPVDQNPNVATSFRHEEAVHAPQNHETPDVADSGPPAGSRRASRGRRKKRSPQEIVTAASDGSGGEDGGDADPVVDQTDLELPDHMPPPAIAAQIGFLPMVTTPSHAGGDAELDPAGNGEESQAAGGAQSSWMTVVAIGLFALWAIGMVVGQTMGGVVHVMLLLAAVLLMYGAIRSNRAEE
jgi:hypothetical protein